MASEVRRIEAYIFSSTWQASEIPYAWICGTTWDQDPSMHENSRRCTLSYALANAADWESSDYKIKYCMVEEVPETCQLQFSLVIMSMSIVFLNIKQQNGKLGSPGLPVLICIVVVIIANMIKATSKPPSSYLKQH